MMTTTGRGTRGRSTRPATGRRDGGAKSGGGSRVGGDVAEAVGRDLAELRTRAPDLADSALAASASALAREIDDPGNSATSKSMCARALLDTLDRLRNLAPPAEEADGLDDLSKRRDARLARGPAA